MTNSHREATDDADRLINKNDENVVLSEIRIDPYQNVKQMLWKILPFFNSLIIIILVIVISFTNSHVKELNKTIDSLSQHIQSYDSVATKLSLSTLTDGTITLDINADAIRLPKPITYEVKQMIKNSVRIWSPKGIKIYTGDYVTWTWSTNENIVECDSTGLILPKADGHINSGPLGKQLPLTYTYQFNTSGIHYYTSENSQTMTGVIIVQDQPSISLDRALSTGPFTSIPSGIQTTITTKVLREDMSGCWQSCYDAQFNAGAPNNPTNIDLDCKGTWIFMGSYDPSDPTKFIIGAFAKKGIFSRVYTQQICQNWGSSTSLPGTLENGVYWYAGFCNNYGTYTYGISPVTPITLSYQQQYTNCPSPTGIDSMSWGSSNGCIGTQNGYTNNAWTSTYKRVIYTNTCNVVLPPY